MVKRLLIPAALGLAAASAALLGACKAGDTGGNTGAGASASASKPATTSNPTSNTAATLSTSAPTGTTEVHADGVRRVGVAELQKMVAGGNVVLYDTRAKAQYDQEHIKGALSMPHNEVEARAGELPRDKTLVFYCT